jgi:hypothetical protein
VHGVIDVASRRKLKRQTATFTSRKMDWLNALNFDRRRHPLDVTVALAIASHLNEESGTAWPSDETIACEAGGISTRSVKYARQRLRKAGWLTWKRRARDTNKYWLLIDKVEATLATRKAQADSRRELRHWLSGPLCEQTLTPSTTTSPSLSSEGVPSKVLVGNALHFMNTQDCTSGWGEDEIPRCVALP